MDQGVLQNVKWNTVRINTRKCFFENCLKAVVVLTLYCKKNVIYWVSESWDNVTQNYLVKSRKKLLPGLADSSNVEQGEANKSEILPLIKCITDFEDATEHTVTERLFCDTEANQLYTDEEIISLV
ncbi:hypothetical protein AVEN_77442-1 [Araneus ventricosus]|uniref:DDE-1 domain-containing protein n=1 Tax=Araneus ventricosus TaxID=182803 RepID=A0A4Y2MU28_ARAVE|nr:hypothetical protein AVEN_77442-1 [Araneus ventricosus]